MVLERRSRRLTTFAVTCGGLLAACTGGGPETTETTISSTTTTLPPAEESDGRLLIGMLIPSDPLLSAPLSDAVEQATTEINEAGGVLDQPTAVIYVDEGETTASTTSAIRSLLDEDVDAIIGPASSIAALSTLDDIVGAGTLACSATATALALDDFPDDGLFFRTVASDSLQARAIAEVTDQTGAQRVAVIHIDDAYGRDLASAVVGALGSGAVTETIPIGTTDDVLIDDVGRAVEFGAQVAIVLADGTDGPRILAAMDEIDASSLQTIVVNDAQRTPAAPQTIANLTAALRQKLVGVAPQAEAPPDAAEFDPPGPFATNAYDCVNVIALAATRAGSDSSQAIADEMSEVSTSGSPCSTYADCVDRLADGLQIDYDGPSGITEIQPRTGVTQRAVFDLFTFDGDGASVWDDNLTVNY